MVFQSICTHIYMYLGYVSIIEVHVVIRGKQQNCKLMIVLQLAQQRRSCMSRTNSIMLYIGRCFAGKEVYR